MKLSLSAALWTVALSTLLWVGYYVSSGGMIPPTEVTTVLVGICLGIVLVVKSVWRRRSGGSRD